MELGTINRTEILNRLFNLSIKKLLSNTLLVCQSETNLTDKSRYTTTNINVHGDNLHQRGEVNVPSTRMMQIHTNKTKTL